MITILLFHHITIYIHENKITEENNKSCDLSMDCNILCLECKFIIQYYEIR